MVVVQGLLVVGAVCSVVVGRVGIGALGVCGACMLALALWWWWWFWCLCGGVGGVSCGGVGVNCVCCGGGGYGVCDSSVGSVLLVVAIVVMVGLLKLFL